MKSPRLITFKGKTQSIGNWARDLNMPTSTLVHRLGRYRWTVEQALTTPPGRKPPPHAKLITYKGKTQSINNWSRETGISYNALKHRVRRGWSIEKVLETPYLEPPTRYERLPSTYLCEGVRRGYSVRTPEGDLGKVYQLRIGCWTHNYYLNYSNAACSTTWRTRRATVIDLLETVASKKNK